MTAQWHSEDQKSDEIFDAGGSGSIDSPDNVGDGDIVSLILLSPSRGDLGVAQFTVPSGFELVAVASSDSSNWSGWAWWVKESDGNEPAQYQFSWVTGNSSRCLAITGRVSGSSGVETASAKNKTQSDVPITSLAVAGSHSSLLVGMAGKADPNGADLSGLGAPEGWNDIFSLDYNHTAMVGATIYAVSAGDSAAWTTDSAARAGVIHVAFAPSPPTDEEVFEASFEDVSGRDPLPTALLERTPARQLANHLVDVYRYPPYLVTKRLPIELQQYDLTAPGRMIWHKDAKSALFSMGRWAQIQGRRFTDNPVEVELTLRISDHPESFEEPT